MIKASTELQFFAYCIEIYKHVKGITGKAAFEHLQSTGGLSFLRECFPALHTASHTYIVESVDDYIENGV
jgi:hypothetical protein